MSFFDHFPGSALDSRWTAVTAASGSVTVSDSTVIMNSPATTDAGFIYYATQLNKAISQLWLICFKLGGISGLPISIINKATAPIAEAYGGGFAARYCLLASDRNSNAFEFRYHDGAAIQRWSTSGSAWGTTGGDSLGPTIVAGDYLIVGIEFDADGGNSRWRMIGAHQSVTSGYSVDQGLRIFALTNWVNWSATRTQADGLWLVIGDPITDLFAVENRVEWVRHGDAARQYLYTNAKNATSGNYGIRTSWSYDGKFFAPKDRTTVDLADVKDPWVVFDGTTYHMFYRTMVTTPNAQIRRATASSPEGAWTEQNTLASPPTDHEYHFPQVINTPWETSGREWQMLVNDQDGSVSPTALRIRLFTASTPGGTWTDRGIVLGLGGVGAADEQGCEGAIPLRRNGQYEVWYTGDKPVGGLNFHKQTGMRATGSALDALTKDGNGARLTAQDEVELIDANLDGVTVTISDTTGFVVDQAVYLNQDNNGDNWSGSRIRKVTANTSVELYHRLMGFTTANGAKIFGGRAGNQQIRDIIQVGSDWWIYITMFNHAKLDSTFVSFQEESALLIVPSGTDLTGMAPSHYSWIDSPYVLRGSWSNIRSNENSSLIHGTTARGFNPAWGTRATRMVGGAF